MGVDREDSTEGGGGTGRIGNFLLRSHTGGTVVQGRDVGAVGANDTEAGRSSYGVPDTGDKFEGKKAEGRFVKEGGDRQSTSGSGDTTDPDLIGQEAGGSGGMGDLTAYL